MINYSILFIETCTWENSVKLLKFRKLQTCLVNSIVLRCRILMTFQRNSISENVKLYDNDS